MTILNMATCLGMQLLTVAMFWMNGVSEHWWPTDWCLPASLDSCCPSAVLIANRKHPSIWSHGSWTLWTTSWKNYLWSILIEALSVTPCRQSFVWINAPGIWKLFLFARLRKICFQKPLREFVPSWRRRSAKMGRTGTQSFIEFQHLNGWRDGRSVDVHNIVVIAVVLFMYQYLFGSLPVCNSSKNSKKPTRIPIL